MFEAAEMPHAFAYREKLGLTEKNFSHEQSNRERASRAATTRFIGAISYILRIISPCIAIISSIASSP